MKKTVYGLGLIATSFTALAAIQIKTSESALFELHPDIPKKIVRKAHRRMYFDLMTGRATVYTHSDEEFEQLFQTYVEKLS